jgi:hypothetical protein
LHARRRLNNIQKRGCDAYALMGWMDEHHV